jgi:hypothetical protein
VTLALQFPIEVQHGHALTITYRDGNKQTWHNTTGASRIFAREAEVYALFQARVTAEWGDLAWRSP